MHTNVKHTRVKYIALIMYSMTKQITIWINEELLEKVRTYAKNKTGSSKALSGTINKIMEEYLSKEQEGNPPSHPENTRTHKKGIDDILNWIKANNPTGITKSEIDRAIKEIKGMDTRTIKKYEPEVINNLLFLGYQTHPANPNLFIRYDLPTNNEMLP